MNAEITPPIEEVVTSIEETLISTDEEVVTDETFAQEDLSNTEESFKQNAMNAFIENPSAASPAPAGYLYRRAASPHC